LNFADVDAASEALDQQLKHHKGGKTTLPTDYHYGRVLVAYIDKVLLKDDDGQEDGEGDDKAGHEGELREPQQDDVIVGDDDESEEAQQEDEPMEVAAAPIPPECRALIVTAIESNPWIAFAMKLHESYQQVS
jgi:hypothetical protein